MEEVEAEYVAKRDAIERLARQMHAAFREFHRKRPEFDSRHSGPWEGLATVIKDCYRHVARALVEDR